MPTYEYVCKGCGHEFERFQKMSDDPVSVCPECDQAKVVRLISSGGGIVFKGPGFYATDYRKSPPPAEGSESGSGRKTEGGSSGEGGSSDSKGGSSQSKGDPDGSKGGSKE